jgi:transcriptional regulator with GAF, ATPase, and Fis domain
MITGETGTGKELIAKAIHGASPRADNMFIAVNSGGLPQDLLESTLFGHLKGSFTGAVRTQKGYFEIANNGTIFFDEVGNISLETQAKLLRVIQEREFMPLGSSEMVRVDVRLLAATNSDLRRLVEDGKFREDLYYRLNVINLVLPPLRERKEDIPLLVNHYIKAFNAQKQTGIVHVAPETMQILMDHPWPGNVRELRNALERAAILSRGGAIHPRHLDALEGGPPGAAPAGTAGLARGPLAVPPGLARLQRVEAQEILAALAESGGKVAGADGAAARLGVPPTTLHSAMKRLGLKPRR